MRLRIVSAVFLAVVCVGCSSNSAEPASSEAVSTAQETLPAPSTDSGVGGSSSVDPTAFLSALQDIDAGLVSNPDRAVSRGQNVCQEIAAGKPEATLAQNAAARFTGGEVTVDQAGGAQIVAAARAHLCTA